MTRPTAAATRSPALTIEDLHAGYGRLTVLRELSVQVQAGSLTVLVGPNGCGKSTLLKAIMGFVPVSHGRILIAGQPVTNLRRRQLARQVAWMPQDAACPDGMTVGGLVELAGYARQPLLGGPTERQRERFRRTLAVVGLSERRGHLVQTLSGGQRQRAWIAMTLAQDTPLILMDEPVNHLDMNYQYAILRLVKTLTREHGRTVVLVLHDLNLAATFADEVLMLDEGRIVAAGSPRQAITAENMQRVFGIGADVFERDGRLVCLPLPD